MRTLKLLCVTLLTVSLGRGVRLLDTPAANELPAVFDREQSAALFVGVREFPNDPALGEVRYAVDDAIDLAWVFALDPRVGLVTPERVVLAIEGKPQKRKSEERLRQLIARGAVVKKAGKNEIETLLARQASATGSGGVLIVGFATHGFSSDGASYVLASSSVYEQRGTSLPTAKILDIAKDAPRSIVFFDACRERQGTRAAPLPPPFIEGLTETAGQVVFTVSGEYAYENSAARNGAFTAAVIDGLQCKADRDARGFVTVDTLADYAEHRLVGWLRRYRDPFTRNAIRLTTDGESDSMPLASCSLPPRIFTVSPARVEFDEKSITAFDSKGLQLWVHPVNGHVAEARVADLDGDRANEVVASVDGKLAVLRPTGQAWWTGDTDTPHNYAGAGHLVVSKFVIGDLYRKRRRQIVALSMDETGAPSSRLSIFDGDGSVLGGYFHPGRLLDVAIGRATSHHAPKIIVTGVTDALDATVTFCGKCSSVFLLDPKDVEGEAPPYRGKLGFGTQVWYGYLQASSIERLEIIDRNNDGKRDIFIAVPNGGVSLDFDGKIIEAKNAPFGLVK
jgi:hypothetical protein